MFSALGKRGDDVSENGHRLACLHAQLTLPLQVFSAKRRARKSTASKVEIAATLTSQYFSLSSDKMPACSSSVARKEAHGLLTSNYAQQILGAAVSH